jgi:hypothetical protein
MAKTHGNGSDTFHRCWDREGIKGDSWVAKEPKQQGSPTLLFNEK